MKGQHLQYNMGHFDGLYITKANMVTLYSHHGHYFIGESQQQGAVHMDLTTQSVLVSKNTTLARARRAARHLQRFT